MGRISGNVYLAKFDSDGNHLWSRGFAGDLFYPKLAADAMGNVVLTAELRGTVDMGGGLRTGAGTLDVLLAKFDPNGDHLLSLVFGDSSMQQPIDLATDPDGNIVLTGWFSGTMDFGGSSITSTG